MKILNRKVKYIKLNGRMVGVIPPEKEISIEEGIREIRKILS